MQNPIKNILWICIVLILSSSFLLPAEVTVTNDWPLSTFDATHSMNTPNSPPSEKTLLWTSSVVGISGPMVVQGGKAFIYANFITAIDTRDGSTVWTHDIPLPRWGGVDSGMVFVGSESGIVYALSASTGSEVWTFATGGRSTPTIANGRVYVISLDGKTYALDEFTGSYIWSTSSVSSSSGAPSVAGGMVYVSSYGEGAVRALKESDGSIVWSTNLGGAVPQGPAVVDGKAFVGNTNGKVFALDQNTGNVVWFFTDAGDIYVDAAGGGIVLAKGTPCCGPAKMFVLDENTGSLLWSLSGAYYSPTIAGGLILVGSSNGYVRIFDKTGSELWSYYIGRASTPIVADNKLFVYSDRIYAFGPAVHLVSATVHIDPNVLDLKSMGQWVTCYIELPNEYNVNQISVNSIKLDISGGQFSVDPSAPTAVGDYDGNGIPDLMVKFDRSAIVSYLANYQSSSDIHSNRQSHGWNVIQRL